MPRAPIELDDVQGIVFYGYREHPFSRYVLFTLAYDDPRTYAWLGWLTPKVRHARRPQKHVEHAAAPERVQVAFSASGLTAFGLAPGDLDSFPREFLRGMNDPAHARIMGDTPEKWDFGRPSEAPIHALLMIFARTEEHLAELSAEHRAALAKAGATIVHEDEGRLLRDSREHFGFHDGISNPDIDGGPRRPKTAALAPIAPGELLLGYEDAYDETPPSPRVRDFDLGTNGSFVVYRTLEQDVLAFWTEMRKRARPEGGETLEEAAIRLAAAMVGRWPGGGSLAKYPDADPGVISDNDFLYAGDESGHACPLGSHARRANPRDMLPPDAAESLAETSRHRIVRRGRPYGAERELLPWKYEDDDGVKRGLVFIALCASLRRQFEFIHQTWVNSPKFAGLYDERDPMLGTPPILSPDVCVTPQEPPRPNPFTLQGEPVRRCLLGLPPFVKMLGGAYFFLPGIRALEWLGTPRSGTGVAVD